MQNTARNPKKNHCVVDDISSDLSNIFIVVRPYKIVAVAESLINLLKELNAVIFLVKTEHKLM
ncbi:MULTISPECIES: hypothetical protein [unclassified Psychrobacter]|uniref:hypothetical protein n=1 Tax=unclassified Psychrobacter TaxID=196806 RepID=UPI00188B8569|nr:hypothetical protein [Psychrobacter sp. N25K4-3-2]MBF4489933.1 hypothetical protein [Psychrobacter sp. N25K4-3-2]